MSTPMSDIITDLRHGPNNGRNSEGAFATLRDGRLMFIYQRVVSLGLRKTVLFVVCPKT